MKIASLPLIYFQYPFQKSSFEGSAYMATPRSFSDLHDRQRLLPRSPFFKSTTGMARSIKPACEVDCFFVLLRGRLLLKYMCTGSLKNVKATGPHRVVEGRMAMAMVARPLVAPATVPFSCP